MILSKIRNNDQSETLFVIIPNLDLWIRCCVKSYIFNSGDYNVKKSRTGLVALVEGLTRNVITNCMKDFNLDQYNVVHLLFKNISYLELWLPSWLAERNHLGNI